jgi:DNA-binding CsgD family transcriptional regulator
VGDDAGRKAELGGSQPSRRDKVEAGQVVTGRSGPAEPEIPAPQINLEMSLFGLSRKLLALDALVGIDFGVFAEASGRRTDEKAQRTKVAVNLLHECVREIITVSRMQNSPLSEIGPDVLKEYDSRYSVHAPGSHSQAREDPSKSCLSKRENEVVSRLTEGKSNKEIAVALGLSVKTIETYRARIMLKLNAHSLSDIFRFALRCNLIKI